MIDVLRERRPTDGRPIFQTMFLIVVLSDRRPTDFSDYVFNCCAERPTADGPISQSMFLIVVLSDRPTAE